MDKYSLYNPRIVLPFSLISVPLRTKEEIVGKFVLIFKYN